MGIRKVTGGKKIDTWKWTIDGREIAVDVYMAKVKSRYAREGVSVDLKEGEFESDPYDVGTTVFHALNEEADAHLVARDIGLLEKEAKKLIETRIRVEWRPMLLVEVTGDRAESKDERRAAQLFASSQERRGGMSVHISIEALDIAEINGKKYHREQVPNDGYVRRPTQVRDGWPTTGDMTKRGKDGYYDYGTHRGGVPRTVTMIDDTPENRAALVAVRQSFERATSTLDALLHPDRAQDTLTRALTSAPALLSLPETTTGKKKG